MNALTHHHGRNDPSEETFIIHPLGVRRLVPLEAERLQGFPDGWTEPAGSDSAKRRCIGNAVAVPVVEWIARRIVELDAE